ncbi:MAG: hypothetical protein ACLQQ0_18950 [Limisphaerales bacterium]
MPAVKSYSACTFRTRFSVLIGMSEMKSLEREIKALRKSIQRLIAALRPSKMPKAKRTPGGVAMWRALQGAKD